VSSGKRSRREARKHTGREPEAVMLAINLIDLTNHPEFPRLAIFGLHLRKGCS
jgi:hypothetical protein